MESQNQANNIPVSLPSSNPILSQIGLGHKLWQTNIDYNFIYTYLPSPAKLAFTFHPLSELSLFTFSIYPHLLLFFIVYLMTPWNVFREF